MVDDSISSTRREIRDLAERVSSLEAQVTRLVDALEALSPPDGPVIVRGPYTVEERISAALEGRVLT